MYKNGSIEFNLEGKNLLKMNDIINYQYVLQCVVDSIINLPSATALKNLYKPKKILEIHIILIKAKVDFRSKFSSTRYMIFRGHFFQQPYVLRSDSVFLRKTLL